MQNKKINKIHQGIIIILFMLFALPIISCGNERGAIDYSTIEPVKYDDSFAIHDVQELDISSAGVAVLFRTQEQMHDLKLEYLVYPSDIVSVSYIFSLDELLHECIIKTYPEGGTVYYRITQGAMECGNYKGTKWFRIDLPRSPNIVIPPPYAPKEKD